MDNVKIMSCVEYIKKVENIFEDVKANKVKLTPSNYQTLNEEFKRKLTVPKYQAPQESESVPVFTEVNQPVQNEVNDTKEIETEMPVQPNFYSGESHQTYNFDETAIKERVATNYGGSKEESKRNVIEQEQKKEINAKKLSAKEFEALLKTDISNFEIKEEMNKYTKLYEQKINNLNDANARRSSLEERFKTISNKEQSAISENKARERRNMELRKKENFGYLELSQNEDPRIVEIMETINKNLTDLLNTNLKVSNETKEQLVSYAEEKITIEKDSAKIREEIKIKTEDLNDFIEDSSLLIIELIEADKMFNKSKMAGQRVIKDEYEEMTRKDALGVANQNKLGVSEMNSTLGGEQNIFSTFRTPSSEPAVEVTGAREKVTSIYSHSRPEEPVRNNTIDFNSYIQGREHINQRAA